MQRRRRLARVGKASQPRRGVRVGCSLVGHSRPRRGLGLGHLVLGEARGAERPGAALVGALGLVLLVWCSCRNLGGVELSGYRIFYAIVFL